MLTQDAFVELAAALRATAERHAFYIALGEGNAPWDQALPDEVRETTRLFREMTRRRVRPEDIVFVDEAGQPVREPTPHLRFSVAFEPGEGTGTLRECALFGGPEATEERGSGRLISYHIHARIGKTDEMTLRRTIDIDLRPRPIVPGSRETRFLGNTNSHELHDLENVTTNCQIDEIRFDHQFFFPSVEAAREAGYDLCAYCFGEDGGEPAPPRERIRPGERDEPPPDGPPVEEGRPRRFDPPPRP